MSESEKDSKLLGKKREPESGSEEENDNNLSKKKQKTSENKPKGKLEKDVEDSSSSSDEQPKQSLFGNNEKGFTGGLFGDLNNPQQPTSLFGNKEGKPQESSLFGNTEGKLFGNLEMDKEKSGSLFGSGLFDFSKINKKKEEEEENEENDNFGKSNSPKHEYNPEIDNNENKEDKDGYIKRYIKKVDKALLYDKLKNNYISKGEGFIIIETQEIDEQKKERYARILFRNTIGSIMFQGILNDQINKCIPYEKKLKHVCHFIFLVKDDDQKNPLSLGQAKDIFTSLDEITKFTEKYQNTIKYIKHEIDDF